MSMLEKRWKYPLSVDCVIFGYTEGELKIALIERKNEPYKGQWAIPGGFVEGDETVEEAAFRELREETGIHDIYLEQCHVFSRPDRDPRGRVITVAFFALIDSEQFQLIASEDALRAKWWPNNALPDLAFDHKEILQAAINSLQIAMRTKPIAFHLLADAFTLSQLQRLYEKVFEIELDKRNFRKKVQKMDFIIETKKMTQGGRHRPAMLYRFDQKLYDKHATDIMF